jgi:CO/xanthine dehydrogenase Mo-binding subunit
MTDEHTPGTDDGMSIDDARAIERLRGPEHRPELVDKVTGRTRFVADRKVGGTLVGAVLTSHLPHARIRAIDTRAAARVPGVRAILTGADLRDRRFGRRLLDRPVLCWDRVLFVGDRIAAVAADTPAAARAALAAIELDLEPLPAILDPDVADAPGAPILHDEPEPYRYLGGERPAVPHPNVQGRILVERDADGLAAAFAQAAHVVTSEYRTPRDHAAHLEPHCTIVVPRADGRLLVHSTNKAPYSLREQLAATFGLDPETIEIDARAIGGDFGAKGYSVDEFVALALARASGAPVRMDTSMGQEFADTSVRHASVVRLRTALDDSGRILAHEAEVRLDGGAYAGAKPIPTLVPGGATSALIAYHVPILRIDARVLYTNTVPGGHVRAPGEVQALFAGESHVDELARAAGLGPLEFRERNAVQVGQTGGSGHGFVEPRAVEVLAAIRADPITTVRRSADNRQAGRGWGMAITARHVGLGGALSLEAVVDREGTITVTTGLTDQGGGAHSVIRRVLAAVLAIDEDRVIVRVVTTSDAGPDRGVGASRTTHLASRAAFELAGQIRGWFDERVAPDQPVIIDRATAARLIGDRPVVLRARYDSEAAHGAHGHHDFAACAVDLSVDLATGDLDIHDVLLAVDVGTVINPVAHRGQIIGGFVFGLGQATMEELVIDAGRIATRNLDTYRLPRTIDIPPIRVVELPTAIGPGAFGAKMAGELTNAVVGPAIANAIADATGARMHELPLTASRIRAAIHRPG